VAAVVDGVLDQVGEQLAEPDRVAGDQGQAPDPELDRGVGGAGVSAMARTRRPRSTSVGSTPLRPTRDRSICAR
jgi:hypothetical protein